MLPIEEFLHRNRLRQVDLVSYLGVTKGHISQVCSGKIQLSQRNLQKLIDNDRGWDVSALIPKGQTKEDLRIPLIPIEAIAGYGKLAYDDLPVESFYQVGVFKNVDFLVRVSGDSMAPMYCGGDLVACRIVKETLFFQWGHVYVINTRSQGVVIKRVQRSQAEGNITCVSENPKYDEFDVPVSDISNIALVVGAITLS